MLVPAFTAGMTPPRQPAPGVRLRAGAWLMTPRLTTSTAASPDKAHRHDHQHDHDQIGSVRNLYEPRVARVWPHLDGAFRDDIRQQPVHPGQDCPTGHAYCQQSPGAHARPATGTPAAPHHVYRPNDQRNPERAGRGHPGPGSHRAQHRSGETPRPLLRQRLYGPLRRGHAPCQQPAHSAQDRQTGRAPCPQHPGAPAPASYPHQFPPDCLAADVNLPIGKTAIRGEAGPGSGG